MKQKDYPLAKALIDNPSRHCATLAVSEGFKLVNNLPHVNHPDENSRNGTITFVKHNGLVFGITCWHVIEYCRNLNSEQEKFNNLFYTMSHKPYVVVDSFIRPSDFNELDIAIRQVRKDFVTAIGKEPIDIDSQEVPERINFGYAVGYPEVLKYVADKSPDSNSLMNDFKVIIKLPTVSILAEIEKAPNDRFKLFSEFDEVTGYETYSGMSGGPIFWSDGNNYGIYGIVYEAGRNNITEVGKSIMVAGELATPDIIRNWISQIPELHKDN